MIRCIKSGVRKLKTTGILKKVDDMEQLVIPKELLKYLKMKSDDSVEIFVEDDRLILKKYEPSCLFCNSVENTIRYMGKNICQKCLKDMEES